MPIAPRPRPRPMPTTRLRALLAEPGGRRQLLRAMDDGLHRGPTDDEQLLRRAESLLERGRLGTLWV